MPRPGSRRHARRPVRRVRARRPRRVPSCAMTRFQEELRLDPQVTEIPGIRHDLVTRVRQEILAGTYDTNAKLEAALERMLVQLGRD
jgi:hypothetical protein